MKEMSPFCIVFVWLFVFTCCEDIMENQIPKNQRQDHFGRRNARAPQSLGASPQKWKKDGFVGRQSRFLSLFTLVQFGNDQCMGATGDIGTCMTNSDCQQRGGTSNGVCANGYGTCCVFLATCGMTVRENGTFFVQNGYPTVYDDTGSCQLTLLKSHPDVCQYRLDFDQFLIMGPENQHNTCNNDQFIISGGNPVPAICGNNIGNHMYVDAGAGSTTPIILSMVTSGPSFQRNWKIKIHQILCSMPNKAEEGCLQYFSGVAGQIRSFNYDPATGLQLSNQDYSICIRSERNFCSIQYTQCPDTVNNRSQSFTLSGNTPTTAVQSMVGSTGTGNFCQNDYLIIPMVSNVGRPANGASPTVDRLCGGILSADVAMTSSTIRSTVKPFRLSFHSDSTEAPTDIGNRGFCLNYVQQPCTNSFL